MGASFNGKAYEEIYKHGKWEETAETYEESLAANLYKASYVQEAARTALTRLSKMLNAYYNDQGQARNLDEQAAQNAQAAQQAAAEVAGVPAAAPQPGDVQAENAAPLQEAGVQEAVPQPADSGNDRVEITDTLIEALLPRGDSSGGAGQIGSYSNMYRDADEEVRQAARQIDEKNLNAVINGDGNLRERMTMLYNGMFINGGGNKEQIAGSRSLKNLMAYITEEEKERIPELQGVRTDLLEEMGHRKSKKDVFDTFSLARDLKNASDKRERRGNWLTRFFQGMHRGFVAAISSRFTRKKRSEEERQTYRLGEEYYNRLGLELSGRESINGLKGTDLQWQEGRAWYEMRKRVNAQGMLQTAGPSGTTLRMLGAYKLMGASLKELLYFRLALIAWMVSSKDHSLYEIMIGSKNAGITGSENLSEPATMYMTVDPVPTEVLRQEVAQGQQFPHEQIYRIMLNELSEKRKKNAQKKGIGDARKKALGLEENYTLYMDDPLGKFDSDARLSEAQDLALNIYTTGAYLAMNRGQKYGSGIAKRSLYDENKEGYDKDGNKITLNARKYEQAFRGELKDSKIKNAIFNMIRISSRMAQDALEERGQSEATAYGGDRTRLVYRGQRLTGDLKAGENAEITLKSLTSSSKNYGKALGFYLGSRKKEGEDKAVLVEYIMHGKGAVDISELSRYKKEEEVLIPANTKFKIVKPLRKAAITREGILWDGPEKEDDEETQQGRKTYGYVISLEEVEGPGSVKREETGEAAEARREIREDYERRLQALLGQQEPEEELDEEQELAKLQKAIWGL